jgi:four helix bundle protein
MNIAEGCGRGGDAEFARFLHVAAGSASEVQYQLLLAHELEFLKVEDFDRLTEDVVEVKRMLSSLIQKLKAVG